VESGTKPSHNSTNPLITGDTLFACIGNGMYQAGTMILATNGPQPMQRLSVYCNTSMAAVFAHI
jgi:hypothetical protein